MPEIKADVCVHAINKHFNISTGDTRIPDEFLALLPGWKLVEMFAEATVVTEEDETYLLSYNAKQVRTYGYYIAGQGYCNIPAVRFEIQLLPRLGMSDTYLRKITAQFCTKLSRLFPGMHISVKAYSGEFAGFTQINEAST
jgi:hypothetical protein